jgi:hypothetical protein
MKFQSQFS